MADESPPLEVESTLAAVAHALLRKGRTSDASLLASASINLEVTGYDNWDGGTTIWEFGIEVPYPDFLALEEEHRSDIEKFIGDAISPFLPETGHWVHAKIRPGRFEDPNWRANVSRPLGERSARQTPKQSSYETENYAFISYQTSDKYVAGRVQRLLAEVGISSFLAHEDIEVSTIWREKILEEIGRADLFISLLSSNYFASDWCMQESGIAAFRNMTALHLSLDGSIPKGFSANVQAAKVDPETVSILELIPGIVSSNFSLGIRILINIVGRSKSFRGAESNFRLILPYVDRMKESQIKLLLEKSAANEQVHHASQCAREYLPPLLQSYGHLLDDKTRVFLEGVCEQYALLTASP